MELTFNDITLSPITHQGNLWICVAELARALGLSREDKVAQIYQRHADEFTSDMTQLIENVVEPQNEVFQNLSAGRCRIFSLRGCHLLAMFARTPVAKAFRKWVLDVLDMLAASDRPQPQPTDGPLSPALRAELKAIVDAKLSTAPADVQGRARAEIWTRFNRHFKIAEYAQLPAGRMAEARDYLIEMQMKTYPANATAMRGAEQEIETHCAAVRSLVAQIDDHMAEIFRIARRGCAATKAGTPRRSLAVNAFYTLEDAANAIGHSLAIMERMAKNIVPASGM